MARRRPIIGLDTCHLKTKSIIGSDACHFKTKSSGQLITAVAKDPNEEYFSFAYAVVDAKTKDSWTWFINLLLTDIG